MEALINYPYVEFIKVKKLRENTGSELIPYKATVKIRVDGCHGHLDNLMQMIKGGMKVVGHGNLGDVKYNDVRRWVDGQTGTNLDPLLRDPSIIDERVKAANDKRIGKN